MNENFYKFRIVDTKGTKDTKDPKDIKDLKENSKQEAYDGKF